MSTPPDHPDGNGSPVSPRRLAPTERVVLERVQGQRPGDQVVRRRRLEFGSFARRGVRLEARAELEKPTGVFGWVWRMLVGEPIHSELESHERLSKLKALAV